MSDDAMTKLRRAAEEEGYELAHGQEGYGRHFFGLLIFVKMSNRKLDRDRDFRAINRAAEDLKRGLDTVSAELDPEGPELRARRRAEIDSIYCNAGVETIFVEAILNGYGRDGDPEYLNTPWFRVTSWLGHVVIGWRRSVLSIDWKDTIVKKTGEELFPDEQVTRWETGIHAHGIGAADCYIRRLHEAAVRP